MKQYSTIIVFVLAFCTLQAHDVPSDELKEVITKTATIKKNYDFRITALYSASKVEINSKSVADTTQKLVTYTGWFKDYHCAPKVSSKILTGSCSVACGTGGVTGQLMVNYCQAHGHGIWINPTDSTSNDGKFIKFDAQSAELLKAFLYQFHDSLSSTVTPNGKLSLETTGYEVEIPTNADESTAPYLDGTPDHYIKGFHALSVRGVVLSSNSYPAFATKDFKLTLDALAPKNMVATTTDSSYRIKFDAPITASALSPKFGVKGYRVDASENGQIIKSDTIANNPASALTQLDVSGLKAFNKYTFHIYTASGQLNNNYNDIYMAVTDSTGQYLKTDEFSVSNFFPLMSMGMMSHSTPVGKVEKVEDKALYKTWFSFLMPGEWTFGFDYTIKGTTGQFAKTDIPVTVNSYPTGATYKWLTNFQYDDDGDGNKSYFYVSLVSPQDLAIGSQTVKAYVNKRATIENPFAIAERKFKIVQIPVMRSMGHSSEGNTNFAWNASDSSYSATTNLFMEGDWRINLAVYDAVADTLIAGTNIGTDYATSSSVYWDIYLDNTSGINHQSTSNVNVVYPTVSSGEVNVVTANSSTIKLFDIAGKSLASYAASAGTNTIHMDVPSGLYLILVNDGGQLSSHKIIIKK
ncbi:MAG: T9SS type A sorting domain-containing protein [Dysgonamonadaceae bacterium]